MKRTKLELIRLSGAAVVLVTACLLVFPAPQTSSTAIFAIKTNEF